MRTVAAAILISASFLATAAAQSPWDKSYTMNGKPILDVKVDDASVRVRSCGGCRTVNVHVDYRGQDPSAWAITELQAGTGLHFSMKHKETRSFFGGWRGRSPEITIATPTETDLTLSSGDGSLALTGLRGNLDAHTGDGSIAAEELSGALRLTTGDGSVQLHRAEGTLYATTGDGSMSLDGRFSQFEARSGDGSIQLRLAPGSTLTSSSSISTGDGSVALSLPRDLHAEIDASTGDGNIASALPFFTNTDGGGRGHRRIHGSMNGGGPAIRIHSGDGSIALSGS